MRNHRLVIPIDTVTVWLHFNGVEAFLIGKERRTGSIGDFL